MGGIRKRIRKRKLEVDEVDQENPVKKQKTEKDKASEKVFNIYYIFKKLINNNIIMLTNKLTIKS